ncbi:TolC family protein [Fimbriiglobus ruber]|uniref:Heavy metal RND efflux outer membrane protein, CzcC family n=1 Tax=Fimbriiglobus ruber TaxID=1908690 RepID=A0A225D7V1_9BACT|nr:TolC family protein [Fimbriiglobus ruber]OWK37680.1 Heavy metal RND efflux outer membrane protein, CzcC family [Fimbriiglobus ruber]
MDLIEPRIRQFVGSLLCLSGFMALGCAATPSRVPPPVYESRSIPEMPSVPPSPAPVLQAAAVAPAPAAPDVKPLPVVNELSADFVVDQVLARNPTIAQMAAAVDAAAARYPQVTSLDDPSFTSWVAPASLGSSKVNDSARFEVSQKLPFFGKRSLRGQSALAQASAAGHDLDDTRLQLVESARLAFADYYLAERGLEVNGEGLKLLAEFKKNAETRYQTGQAPQQDVLQAEVETGKLFERKLSLVRARRVAAARLNTLMNLPADSPLPPPPKGLAKPSAVPETAALREVAVARRPDLQALAARISADQASLALAQREYYPDIEAMAAYDSFWQASDGQQRLRPQVGVRMNLPVRLDRRRGAVAEAAAQLAQRQAQLTQQVNQVGLEVEQSAAQVRESEQGLKLYEEKILPAARENVKAAQTAYVTGKVPFLTLIEAQRNLVDLRDRYYQTGADYQQRRAVLERVIGGAVLAANSADPKNETAPR